MSDFDYLHFRVPRKTRQVIDRIAVERGSSLAAVCRDLIMTSPGYVAACHPGHPVELGLPVDLSTPGKYVAKIPGVNQPDGRGYTITHNLGVPSPIVHVYDYHGETVFPSMDIGSHVCRLWWADGFEPGGEVTVIVYG